MNHSWCASSLIVLHISYLCPDISYLCPCSAFIPAEAERRWVLKCIEACVACPRAVLKSFLIWLLIKLHISLGFEEPACFPFWSFSFKGIVHPERKRMSSLTHSHGFWNAVGTQHETQKELFVSQFLGCCFLYNQRLDFHRITNISDKAITRL